ncbi:MAG: phosphoribosylaminoimidazolesuccinocarboxamide synthase [Methanomicrobiales archaeon]|nr:phosphoribosylaminoimidazolesuccinocarboxamide synthase [Methanomicrobiales archaeon]MDD1646735.1 phosphoribosylaminoimidazolesuccinocarboxamide synthase [Methanomicrobiales archaeon]
MKKGGLLYRGKAKSVYRTDVPQELVVEFRDDITAFDGGKKASLAEKGTLNARVSAFFFELLEKAGIRTHYLGMIDPSTMRVRTLTMIPLEVIVRNVAAGSIVKRYPFTEGQPLDPPILVIDYKDDARHDPMINDEIILALKIVSAAELQEIKRLALAVNRVLRDHLKGKGITLVDFKIEFGKDGAGNITLGDEISMDSMRLWDTGSGQSMDKDVYRFDKGDVMDAYRRVAERITAAAGGRSR